MKTLSIIFVAAIATALATPAFADKDKDKDNGKGRGQGQTQDQGNSQAVVPAPGGAPHVNVVITERDRGAVYTYYRSEYAAGNCPPGLAKKNNGCLPSGQAKKMWVIGQPLPPAIVFYPLPGVLVGQLTPPPSGYQYVRVANDILLMAIGTRLIAGAVADLGSL